MNIFFIIGESIENAEITKLILDLKPGTKLYSLSTIEKLKHLQGNIIADLSQSQLIDAFIKFYVAKTNLSDHSKILMSREDFTYNKIKSLYKEKFRVHIGNSVSYIPPENISHFIKNELVFLIDKENNKYITGYQSLDQIEKEINPHAFYRANRQHLINLPFIDSYQKKNDGKIILKLKIPGSNSINVSKEKASHFRKWFQNQL